MQMETSTRRDETAKKLNEGRGHSQGTTSQQVLSLAGKRVEDRPHMGPSRGNKQLSRTTKAPLKKDRVLVMFIDA